VVFENVYGVNWREKLAHSTQQTQRPHSSSSEEQLPDMRDFKNRSVIIDRPLAHEALLLSTEEDEVEDVDELDTKNFEASGAL
jgi:hypothetical protein